MAVTSGTRRKLEIALANKQIADEVADLIDTAGAGSLSAAAERRIKLACPRAGASAAIITGIEATTDIAVRGRRSLRYAIGQAAEIDIDVAL